MIGGGDALVNNEAVPMKALLVEDDDLQKVIIEETLLKAYPNLELTIRGSLNAALETVEKERFQVVLLDLGLPDSKGIDTLTAMHMRCPQTPIVVLTASEGGGLGTLCVQAGAQDFLQKQKLAPENLFQALEFAVHRKTGSVLLDIHRVLSQLKAIAPAPPGESTLQFSKIYCRLLTEPRFLMTPEHKLLAQRMAEAGATSESVIALHAKCLAQVCNHAKNIDRVRYIQNSTSVVLATINFLSSFYEAKSGSAVAEAAPESSEPEDTASTKEEESPSKEKSKDDDSDGGEDKKKSKTEGKGSTQEALARLRARRAAKKKKARKVAKEQDDTIEVLKKKRKSSKTRSSSREDGPSGSSEEASEERASKVRKRQKKPSDS